MVEFIGIWNDAFHEHHTCPPNHFLWQKAVSDLHIFEHQQINISLGSMLEHFHTMIKGGSFWDLKFYDMQVLAI